MIPKRQPSVTLLAATSNPLLESLSKRLAAAGLHVARISATTRPGKSRLDAWRRNLETALKGTAMALRAPRNPIAFHFFPPSSAIIAALLNLTGRRYVVHMWGSDFFYWRDRNNWMLRFVLRRAEFVSFANTKMLSEARQLWGGSIRFRVLRFGLDALDHLRNEATAGKDAAGSGPLNVVIGTNSQIAQQHQLMIDAIESMSSGTQGKCAFIFPLNYGDRTNRERVLERLRNVTFRHTVLDKMIFESELADFRRSTHVLVQIQTHDALSGAMLESLYAGACVITGTWLPYEDLRQRGVDWIEIESPMNLAAALESAIDRPVNGARNRSIVAELADWRQVLPEWVVAYRDLGR